MRRILLGVLTIIGVFAVLCLFYVGSDKQQLSCVAKNVYFEARNEPMLGQQLVAWVTVNRANANDVEFGGPRLCGVVYQKITHVQSGRTVPQFSWTLLPKAQQTPKDMHAWGESWKIAQDVIVGNFVPDEKYRNVFWYMNPKTSSRHNVCWFRTHLVSVGVPEGSQHEFFRRPKDETERLGLMAANVPECKPPPARKHEAKK